MSRQMSPILWLVIAAAMIASPVAAQDAAPAPASSPEAAPAKSDEERAIEAEAAAFSQAMIAMQDELVRAAEPDEADAIVEKYQPAADALADRINVFLTAHANQPENAERRDELLTQAVTAVHRIQGMPQFIRQAIDRAIAEGKAQDEAEAQAAPEAPPPADSAAEITPEPSPAPSSDQTP